jgi:excisionase family DNA binding protein
VDSTLPRLLTVSDVSDWLSLPSRQVLRLVRQGQIPCIVLPGDEVVFDRDELIKWFESLREQRKTAGDDDAA